MENIININEASIVKKCTKIGISVNELILFKSVSLTVCFYDESDSICKVEILRLSGSDYEMWSSDDKYIENYVMNKLNLSAAVVVDPVPPSDVFLDSDFS